MDANQQPFCVQCFALKDSTMHLGPVLAENFPILFTLQTLQTLQTVFTLQTLQTLQTVYTLQTLKTLYTLHTIVYLLPTPVECRGVAGAVVCRRR